MGTAPIIGGTGRWAAAETSGRAGRTEGRYGRILPTSEKLRSVGGLFAIVALAALAFAVPIGVAGRFQVAAASPSPAGDQVVASEGRSLYLQSCAACHGPQGAGTADGPSLLQSGAAAVDFMLRTGRMPLSGPGAPVRRGPPSFNEDQIAAMVAYLSSVGTGPALPTVDTASGDLNTGRQIYINSCAACHGASAQGGSVGGGFVAPSLLESDPRAVGEAIRIGPGPMPVFDEGQLSQHDVDSIAAYLDYLGHRPSPGGLTIGGVGPVAEGYVAWVVGIGALVLVALWIERRHRT